MKRYRIYNVWCVVAALLFTACTVDELVQNTSRKDLVEGIPVQVKLAFAADALEKVQTRASLSEVDENKVNNIHLFVFNNNSGALEDYFPVSEVADNQTSLTLKLTSGAKRIYALANVNGGGISTIDAKAFTAVRSIADLQALSASLSATSVSRLSGSLLMSGAFVANSKEETNEGYCVIETDGSTTNGAVQLTHVDSKIRFEVLTVLNADSVFVPKKWRVVNVPMHTSVIAGATDYPGTAESTNYFDTAPEEFEDFTLDGTNTRYKGGSFVFYMYENRKKAKEGLTSYADREAEIKNADGTNSAVYKYVEPNATFVELTGSFSSYKGGALQTSADVRYVIHLGGGQTDYTNFESLRNKSYTYKVQVNGVEDIVVEVSTGGEPRPGAEGDVVRTSQNLSLDAHYETEVVTFYKDQLSNLSVLVKTPYCDGKRWEIDASGKITGDLGDKDDYKWVEFCKNNRASKDFAAYTSSNKTNFKDIKGLLQELHKNRNNKNFWTTEGGKQLVRYTVFVNEFYYADQDTEGRWKEFVNVPNREMHILCNTEFSADKESSLTTSSIMINQRSIKSFYNTGAESLTTAWGVESVDESGVGLHDGGSSTDLYPNTLSNGRYNMWTQYQAHKSNVSNGTKWTTYINPTNNKLETAGKRATLTCFQRNRDLNGNGMIDADEVRWYLPATNQYVGMWLGRDALPPEARLFQGTVNEVGMNNRYSHHYLSSNVTRIWSEEGIATGNTQSHDRSGYKVRCARNLGGYYTGTPKEKEEPIHYVGTNTKNEIDLKYVNTSALRSEGHASISIHHEHTGGDFNRPYPKFVIAGENITLAGELSKTNVSKWNTACVNNFGSGYRVPNQRELALMVYNYPSLFKGEGNIGTCTGSDLTFKSDKIYQYQDRNGGYIDLDAASVPNVRCVKDIK